MSVAPSVDPQPPLPPLRIGIAGAGAIALANAAWLARAGHQVTVWTPRRHDPLRRTTLLSLGVIEGEFAIAMTGSITDLVNVDFLMIAAPANAHRDIAQALLPVLHDGQTVLISAMSSLSALFLFEAARQVGRSITVASLASTVFTARREATDQVRVSTRRQALNVSALPQGQTDTCVRLCTALYGAGFAAEQDALASTLSNVNPVSHGPLALFNWTRIERAEAWPQYHYMTPHVAAVIERLDAERLTLAHAFGLTLYDLREHFARSFGATEPTLADIAAGLHQRRGGPPGPTTIDTRFFAEDMPFGLAFCLELASIVGIELPATRIVLEAAALIAGRDYRAQNDLLAPLRLAGESRDGLLARVRGDGPHDSGISRASNLHQPMPVGIVPPV